MAEQVDIAGWKLTLSTQQPDGTYPVIGAAIANENEARQAIRAVIRSPGTFAPMSFGEVSDSGLAAGEVGRL